MNPDRANLAARPRPGQTLRDFLSGGVGERAIAATEFALILPVALLLFSGAYVYGTINEINRKVTLTARDVTDLVTQYTAIADADMTTVLNSSAQVMAPFSNTNLTLIVSEVTINAAGVGTIIWSVPLSGTSPYTANSTLPASSLPSNISGLPAATGQASVTVIWGHAAYPYTPTIGYMLTNTINLSDDIYLSPRMSSTIAIHASTSKP
jgi:Flp pilus assembly protein TadG